MRGTHTQSLRRFGSIKADPENTTGLRGEHEAVVEGRTLFRSTVKKPSESPRLLVSSHNNRKIGRKVMKGELKGFPIFHLTLEERKTCPRSCYMWKDCYGNQMPFARRHDAVSNTEAFERRLEQEIAVLQKAYQKGFLVRLHILGDFYSVAYVKFWEIMLRRYPALHVYGYTSYNQFSEDLEEAKIGRAVFELAYMRWSRFAVRVSEQGHHPMSAVVVEDINSVGEAILCPAQTEASECCATCGLCWASGTKEKPIAFLRHGMKRRGRRKAPALQKTTGALINRDPGRVLAIERVSTKLPKLVFSPTAREAVKIGKMMGFERICFDLAQYQTKEYDASQARFAIWYAMRQTGLSLPMIGRYTGGFDHTSVLNGIRRAPKLLDNEKLFKMAALLCEEVGVRSGEYGYRNHD